MSINLTTGGIWRPISEKINTSNYSVSTVGPFYGLMKLPNGNTGIVLTGWALGGTNHLEVSTKIFEFKNKYKLEDATSTYLTNDLTNGAASVVITDLNNDAIDDIILLAHNESPLLSQKSTAFLSNNQYKYDRIEINDSVAAPHAISYKYNGVNSVFSATNIGDQASYYQLVNGVITRTGFVGEQFGIFNTKGGSIAIADFNGDSKLDVVLSDATYGPEVFGLKPLIEVATISDLQNNKGQALAWLTPYFNDKPAYSNIPGLYGPGLTHVPRVWVDDFNHDGRPDILASALMWTGENGMELSILQMFQNTTSNGTASFKDVTDLLNPNFNTKTVEIDKSMQIVDFDKSGINSYFLSSCTQFDEQGIPKNEMSSNFILLNDGTGKIHIYKHTEFNELGKEINNYAKQYLMQSKIITTTDFTAEPRFIEVSEGDGIINLIAIVSYTATYNGKNIQEQLIINTPINFEPIIDYTKNIQISDRNHSSIIRTWAGNDLFKDLNSNSKLTNIDGGLGIDTSAYSLNFNDYIFKNISEGIFTIQTKDPINELITNDSIKNIERINFKDTYLAIDLNGNAGKAVKILGAVFGKDSINNKNYVGIGLNLLDAGWSYDNLAALALDAAGAKTNDQIVSLLWTNVIGTKPTDADKQPFIELLENGMTPSALAHLAADSSFNTTNINLVGLAQAGIEYIPI